MNTAWRVAAGIPGLIFMSIGVGWWIAPGFVGAQLGMTLLSGAGLGTQIGDLASFFLTLGACILIGLATAKRVWLYPPMILLGLAIAGRFIAWLFHDAELLLKAIAVEGSVTVLLIFAARKLAK
jgi:hypothetical protein